jgi:hypothetical protein
LVAALSNSYSQTIIDEMQVDEVALENMVEAIGTPRGLSCSPKVSVKYVDKGYVIKHVGNPDDVISHKSRIGRVAGFAQYRGINSAVDVKGFGCNRMIAVTITWNSPIIVVMPHKSQVGACRFNRILHHEMEHVRVYLKVPRDFEDQIARAASSSNPRAALDDLNRRITDEIIRRNDQFHAFEARLPTVHRC